MSWPGTNNKHVQRLRRRNELIRLQKAADEVIDCYYRPEAAVVAVRDRCCRPTSDPPGKAD